MKDRSEFPVYLVTNYKLVQTLRYLAQLKDVIDAVWDKNDQVQNLAACTWLKYLLGTENNWITEEIMQWLFRLCVRSGSQPAVVCACVCELLTRVFLWQWCWHYSHHHYHHYLRWAATHSTLSLSLAHTLPPSLSISLCLLPSVQSHRLRRVNVFCRKYTQQRHVSLICLLLLTLAHSLTPSLAFSASN